MSRAFTPPDTLSQDDIRTVADVRRAVWVNGLFGLGFGSVAGMLGHLALQTLQRRHVGSHDTASPAGGAGKAAATASSSNTKSWKHKLLRPLPPLGKNTFLLSFLGGGALGSFLMSTTAGKNAVHLLHPIFNVGRDEYAGKSPYQIAISKAQKQQQQRDQERDGENSRIRAAIEQDELDIIHHSQRALHRKESMKRRLESGHSLSDTHSNTWPEEEKEETEQDSREKAMHRAEVWERRQTNRRLWIKDKIETGHSLSDSHVRYSESDQQVVTENDDREEIKQKEKGIHRADAFRRRQTNRRKLVQERIEKGGGAISNSTGGHWVEE